MTSFDLDLTKYQLGWSDEVEYAFTPEKGINAGVVEQISWWKGEPRWMTQHAPAQPQAVRPQADGRVVRRQHARHRLPGHLLLPAPVGRAGRRVGRPARADEGDVREARHPRGRAQVPRRRHRPVRVARSSTTATATSWPSRGSCSATWTPRCASTPTWSSSTSARSSRPATTSSPPSTRRCGRAARSSTSRRASSARCRCRRTSASTPRTPASSSAR